MKRADILAKFNSQDLSGQIWFLFSWIFSVLFHPLLVPTFIVGLLFRYCTDLVPLNHDSKVTLLTFVFITTYLVPSLFTGFLWVSGMISSIDLKKRSERLIPLLVTGIVYTAVSYIFLDYLQLARLLGIFMGGIAFVVMLTALITYFWKISSHMVGMGGLLGFLIAVIAESKNMALLDPFLFFIVATGATASARLYLQAHSMAQIISGFFMGLMVSWALVYFFV